MTQEEAIERIKMILEEATANEDAVSYVTSDDKDALDMSIKALKQYPVLDKIRTEIEHHRRKTKSIDPHDLIGDCLDIIDKCRKDY